MYQPYPGGGGMPERPRPEPPASVRQAVWFMYAGAAASLISMIIGLTTLGSTRSVLAKRSPGFTASQLDAAQHALLIGVIVGGIISIGLWIFIAQACRAGKNWARITGTVFFGIATLDVFGTLTAPFATAVRLFPIVSWLIGFGAVVLLWQSSSSAFFRGSRL